ncbi:MAG: hypothetical protein ABIS06_05950 [Vicinamibacterales bacterium]
MKFVVCPFCGVASEVAHPSQEACIEALQSEIARTRAILAHVGDSLVIRASDPESDRENEHS